MEEVPPIAVVRFSEHPVRDYTREEISEFDITAKGTPFAPDFMVDGAFSDSQYCICLLDKLLAISKLHVEAFISYQCEQMNSPIGWLEQLEFLVSGNRTYLGERGKPNLIYTSLEIIDRFRERYYMDLSIDMHQVIVQLHNSLYDIDKLRKRLEEMNGIEEKLDYLEKKKARFKQQKLPFSSNMLMPIDKQLELEIKRLKKTYEIKKEVQKEEKIIPEPNENYKLSTNLTVDELAYLFRILLELGYVKVSPKTRLFRFIAENFRSRRADELSWKSIKNSFNEVSPKVMESMQGRFYALLDKIRMDKKSL